LARPTGLIQIAFGRSSPLRGALRASKTLARFVEQSSILGHHTTTKGPGLMA